MSDNHNQWFRRTCNALVLGLGYCAWPFIIISVLLAGLSIYYTLTNLKMETSRSDLISSNQSLVALSNKVDKEFGSHDGYIVVVENTDKRRSIQFAEALAAELRKNRDDITQLFYRVNPEPLKKWALQFLDEKQLLELKEKLTSHEKEIAALSQNPTITEFFRVVNTEITESMISDLFTSFLEEENETTKIPDLSLLNGTLNELRLHLEGATAYTSPFRSLFPGDLGDFSQEGYFFTDNDKFLLFLVTGVDGDFETKERVVQEIRQAVNRVQKNFPGLQVGVTGGDALEADEMRSAMRDITLATAISLLGQMLLFIFFFRSFRRTLAEGVVLIIGLCLTLGLTTRIIGHLNILSVVFAPLMLGLTIDYGCHWFARLEEEQGRRKKCSAVDVSCTLKQSSPGIVYAALAASASFFPLVFTGFKGLAELGLILALGVLLMLVVTLVLAPSFVILGERCTPESLEGECRGHPRPFLSLRWERPWVVAAVGVALVILGAIAVKHVPFDLNPLHLQNPKTESVQWEMKLLSGARYSTSYGVLTADSLSELKEKTAALKRLYVVSHVESVLDFLPEDVAVKQVIIRSMAPMVRQVNFRPEALDQVDPQELANILGRIHFKLAEAAKSEWTPETRATQKQVLEADRLLTQIATLLNQKNQAQLGSRLGLFQQQFFKDLNDKWQLIRGNIQNRTPFTIANLPKKVLERFVSPQGAYLIQVFPSQDIWDPRPLGKFVKGLQSVDPNAVGDPVLLYVFIFFFRNSILWASGMALLVIFILLVILFRSLKSALLALIPLWVGTGLTMIIMGILQLPFNQANVLFLPLILGEGIEFGIIILARWRLEESARALTLPASTAKGVLLAALTTTVGFGSLMVSGEPGVFSLGLLATVGSLSVLLASLSVLPAALRLVGKPPLVTKPAFPPFYNLRHWIRDKIRKETP